MNIRFVLPSKFEYFDCASSQEKYNAMSHLLHFVVGCETEKVVSFPKKNVSHFVRTIPLFA